MRWPSWRGQQRFAFDLYQAVRGDDNLFFSPYSISLALAMTYAGARSETEEQMAATLHFTLPQDQLHPAFHALHEALAGAGEDFVLNIANSIWGAEGYSLRPVYEAAARPLLRGAAAAARLRDEEAARATINEWISDRTEGRIPELIEPGMLTAATRLVLANAIYFNAGWKPSSRPEPTIAASRCSTATGSRCP